MDKYFPPAKIEKLLLEIENFIQQDYDTLHEAYERFNDLLRKCPHYGLSDQLKVWYFYRGLNQNTMTQIDNRAGDYLLKLYPEDALQLLENMTSNSNRAHERSPPRKQLASAETS